MVYAVSDNGDLLWKNYIHGGIWDLGSSVTPLSDGGYMVYGLFDAVNWGGCCYNLKWDVGDIVKLNGEGQVQWRKEIDFGDGWTSSWYNDIGKYLIETSNGDLVFIAPNYDHDRYIFTCISVSTDGRSPAKRVTGKPCSRVRIPPSPQAFYDEYLL